MNFPDYLAISVLTSCYSSILLLPESKTNDFCLIGLNFHPGSAGSVILACDSIIAIATNFTGQSKPGLFQYTKSPLKFT